MRKTMLKTMSGVTLAILLALTLSPVLVSGQDAKEQQSQDAEETQMQNSSENSARAGKLEGTWRLQVTARNCQTGEPIRSGQLLITYVRGGTLLETSNFSSALRSTGQGVWHHNGGRRYAATFMFFRFNPDGSFAGTTKGTQDIELSRDGDEINTTVTLEVRDANDNFIFTGCSTATGTRLE